MNPPCSSSKQAMSFIMSDEKKKKSKSRVVVGGESSCRLEGSGANPDIGVSPDDQFPPDPPIFREAVVSEEAKRRLEDEGTEVDDESEIISVGGPLSIVGGESEAVTFEEAVRREMVSFQRQRLPWILLDYRFVSFRTFQYPLNFY